MKRIFYVLLLVIFAITFFRVVALHSQDDRNQFEDAVSFAKDGDYDFAFMGFRGIIMDFPESEYAKEAAFGIGEYFYTKEMYRDAIENFSEYLKKYPDAEAAIFAKAYLLKIMQKIEKPTTEEEKIISEMEMSFFSKPLFLLFSEYKESSYKSPLQNQFTIRYYVDAIEIYRNEEIFLKITP